MAEALKRGCEACGCEPCLCGILMDLRLKPTKTEAEKLKAEIVAWVGADVSAADK